MHASPHVRLALTLFACTVLTQGADPPPGLVLEPAGTGLQIRLPQPPVPPVGGTRFKLLLEVSSDLRAWSPDRELESSDGAEPQVAVLNKMSSQFYRLRPELEDTGVNPDGADLFGYNRVFKEELRQVGYLKPEEFAAAHQPSADYLNGLSFDPTTAKFWSAFATDPAVFNASLPAGSLDKRLYDFRLNEKELALFKANGFVVSQRLGSSSFADVFYRIFTDDLPVFVSADAILHAWHFSYQRLLEEAEETQLAPALGQILDGMQAQLAGVPEAVRSGPLQESIRDADYYLGVARALLSGQQASTLLGNDPAVTDTLARIAGLQFDPAFEMFGAQRPFDFSQFKIRGHYERSEGLGRYFQAFMWTARVDFRVLTVKPDPQSLRELGTAFVLSQLLQASGQAELWRQLDDVIRLFVGRTDAMTFTQFQPLLQVAGMTSLESIASLDQLQALQQNILNGRVGAQLIAGDGYFSPCSPEQFQLPRAFVLTGQRFTPDAWALGQVIFDRIQWNEEIPGATFFGKVIRRYCSALDMAYSVLGNRQIGWEIAQRMLATEEGTQWRDGLPYAHNLTALARTFDRIPEGAWAESISSRWLAALRELSAPTTGSQFPEAMRTRPWAMRTLNTQLASYTELKHDTVLYAKQPYTGIILCEYPAGFVEPVPGFWRKMKELAESTATNLARLPASGTINVSPGPTIGPWSQIQVDLAQRQALRVNFCTAFANQMAVLEVMAARELQQQPFTEFETAMIRGLMNRQDRPYYGPTFDGWYPLLFYKDYGQSLSGSDSNGSNKPDPLVTDVQTAPPDQVDPEGGVLHQATGNVDLLLIAVDNGPDRMVYAGPLLSHYEFIVPGPTLTRLSDSQWQSRFPRPGSSGSLPPRPDWTRSYLVPHP